ncbi:MAG TPA: winged helix-turn-helix transcriptional regulator [Acidimicrobiia bacterium]|nr:winged helix-turn-helix transcriptional regulator [Acidimicrobiia bacterium]
MSRTYQQYCPVARALEIVGERWTLLIARELLLGPRRFTDLMDGLPGISATVLASRLKDLEQAGLVSKRTLPPPAASTVYELTDRAVGLARILTAMADWGMSMLGRPRKGDAVRGEWMVLAMAVTTPVPDVSDTTFELHVDGEVLHVDVRDGRLQPRQGAAPDPAAIITVNATTLADLALGRLRLDDAVAKERVTVVGDQTAARGLLESISRARVAIT